MLHDAVNAGRPALWGSVGNNVAAVRTAEGVDRLNAEFYGAVQYPPAPAAFERVAEPFFWSRMLAQDIGYWNERIVGAGSHVWVAGCGTNQGLGTALKFPEAHVLGSDLSSQSLLTCERHAREVGANNLELHRESIYDVRYENRFDYVLCTGVIHHNADPASALRRLAAALTRDGLLELMVYNQHHRIGTAAFQLAIRTMLGTLARPDLQREAAVAKVLLEPANLPEPIARSVGGLRDAPLVLFADSLLQPVEYSYSVATLNEMATACGLEIVAFTIDQFSQLWRAFTWNLSFGDADLQAAYDALPDVDRWQVSNCLLLDKSPMLWFYLQRQDSTRPRRDEKSIADEFLERRFRRSRTEKEMFIRGSGESYSPVPQRIPFPPRQPPDPIAARVYEVVDEHTPIAGWLDLLGLKKSFRAVHSLRVHLATTANPFLVAV